MTPSGPLATSSKMVARVLVAWLILTLQASFASAFALALSSPKPATSLPQFKRTRVLFPATALRESKDEHISVGESPQTGIWLPQLRWSMAGVASMGAIETAFLTHHKATEQMVRLCQGSGDSDSCLSVLDGPFSYVPFTNIPLSAVGFLGYTAVIVLAVAPILVAGKEEPEDDRLNRMILSAVTTTMGVASAMAMALLFGHLHKFCAYCMFSAVCSCVLASWAWVGGCWPEDAEFGTLLALISVCLSTLAAVLLVVGFNGNITPTPSDMHMLHTATGLDQLFAPPAVTTGSSDRALQLGHALHAMHAKLYGAHWCSHCDAQKQLLGQPALGDIEYVECGVDGVNSQSSLCQAKQIPAFPTWEINGNLFPGLMELDELEGVVAGTTAR